MTSCIQHLLPLMRRLPGAIFQQDNARPAQSSDLSPIERIWDHLGRRVGHPTSLNELEIERSEHSDLSDDDNAVNKTYELRILERESSCYESDEETHENI
ncbi:hypothetical protein TNCV_3932291 [Trichonephila clavipes]|nr:hypothetical protein TNCV_3932291 [Trichonephila clavipes]